ncbi:hypothetical protein ACLBKU_02700 [Erythrobacter sp. NE805]|uniref:hypothetical protein n=1 Tax=Erythrobacter sp. NE805 TaxID=3389875 RepID=UPI00396AFC61
MTRDINPGLADSDAARMLAGGIERASRERRLSARKIAEMLNYKQSVVLSHMASGRVPIPIDRAEEIAMVLELDREEFLKAVLKQRHPDVDWRFIEQDQGETVSEGLVHELAVSMGRPLRELSAEQRAVMREVAADPHPRRRWLSVHELIAVEAIRDARPAVTSEGLNPADLAAVRQALCARGES